MVASAAELRTTIIENQGKMFVELNSHAQAGETIIFFVCPNGICSEPVRTVAGNFHTNAAEAYAAFEGPIPSCDHGVMQVPRFALP